MQPVQEDIMALLKHHGLVGDGAARALMLCSAPIDAASATLCAAELKTCPTIPTVVTHGKQRNIDGRPTIPRVTMHGPATNVPDAAPGTPPPPPRGLRPPLISGTLPPMNVVSTRRGRVTSQASLKSAAVRCLGNPPLRWADAC